jgi:hypothetical protein
MHIWISARTGGILRRENPCFAGVLRRGTPTRVILSGSANQLGERALEESAARPARRRRPSRRPERQQILLRRALALGAGLVVLILIVIGVKGCLDARKHRALSDYAGDVSQIVQETQQTSKHFFGNLSAPGDLSVTEFEGEVDADRSAMDTYLSRVDGLGAPGGMGRAQSALEMVYELRAGAMREISEEIDTALGEVGVEKATKVIAQQMSKLYAADVVYASIVRPEIDRVLAASGIEGEDVPKSVFLPDGAKWLDEGTVSSALGAISGNEGSGGGVHGLELTGVGLNGTELSEESPISVALEEATPEVEVEVQNQGESTENGVNVSVSVNGGSSLEDSISSLGVEETQVISIPLVPAPGKGEATIEVEVEPVAGEEITENNEATYTVVFE